MDLRGLIQILKSSLALRCFFEAVLGELRVVGQGHPHLILEDFIVEPSQIPCLFEGISEGSLLISQDNSLLVGAICLLLPAGMWDTAGTRRDFVLVCPASFAACLDCWVDPQRLFQPHFLVRVAFDLGRWSARVVKNKTCTHFGLQVGSLL